jgi:hypothetical protein
MQGNLFILSENWGKPWGEKQHPNVSFFKRNIACFD